MGRSLLLLSYLMTSTMADSSYFDDTREYLTDPFYCSKGSGRHGHHHQKQHPAHHSPTRCTPKCSAFSRKVPIRIEPGARHEAQEETAPLSAP
ncbi:hypothetical protein DFP72DRAFT_885295 [Ephemerocybe angulata]|uniref:Secreted protein n=1 Tax=Ephemerocybe angulata TaxID=980116 RepID=A0A8H6MBX8_9AGAR|nr:hypothetical protein DFP72DRAFT_885295 [Tulosesus angulatus]